MKIKNKTLNKEERLDNKINEFIKWYIKEECKENENSHYVKNIKKFIEKMAVWYELRYPDYEINKLIPATGQEIIKVSDVMFNRNNYINDLLDENSDVRALDWDEFYNTSAFIKALPWEERNMFQRVKYKDLVYVNPYCMFRSLVESQRNMAHLHLTSNGFVESAEGFVLYSHYKITNEQLKGMHVKEVVNLLKEKNITLPSDNELEAAIDSVEKRIKLKEGLLDAVMYRIIERGRERIGPRRAFLFAKEFERDIDVPMKYGVDFTDPYLRNFVNEYIKAGGSKDLKCYCGNNTNETVSVEELLLTEWYTQEEKDLQQRLVNSLASYVDSKKLEDKKRESKLKCTP